MPVTVLKGGDIGFRKHCLRGKREMTEGQYTCVVWHFLWECMFLCMKVYVCVYVCTCM